jgi:FeS assembly protein IscX
MRWIDVEEIAEALEENYPSEDVVHIRFTTLHEYITELLDFDDDPGRSNERILEAIQAAWLELREENE